MQQSVIVDRATKSLSENQASEIMWVYYRDNKAQLVSDIREYRDFIYTQIVAGVPAAQAFKQFTRAPEPKKPALRTT